jgi:hypothetical protein
MFTSHIKYIYYFVSHKHQGTVGRLTLPRMSQHAMSRADFTYGCPFRLRSIRSFSSCRRVGFLVRVGVRSRISG